MASDLPVADHLDKDTLIKLAGYATIGSPETETRD